MSARRTKSVSTKVTAEEYARLAATADTQTVSEWARGVLLTATTPHPVEAIVLAELLALRTILLNLHFAIGRGEQVTAETMQRLIAQADHDKIEAAQTRLGLTLEKRRPL